MVAGFNDLLLMMEQADFFTGLLPFLLSYVIFFVALKQVPLFSNNDDTGVDERFAAIISIGLAFFVAQFVAQTPAYQQFFVDYLGFVAVLTIGLIGLLILLSFTGYTINPDDDQLNWWVIIFLGLAGVAGFFVTGGADLFIPETETDQVQTILELIEFTLESGLIWIIAIIGVIAVTMSSGSESKRQLLPPYPFENPDA